MKSSKDRKVRISALVKITLSIPGSTVSFMTAIADAIEKTQELQVSLIKELIDKIASKESKKSQSIVSIMIDSRAKGVQKAFIFLAITLLGQLVFTYFTKSEISSWFILFLLFLACALYLNQTILEYRVKKGLYGANDYEAREIVEFIFANAEHVDFSSGDGAKRIFPEPEKETQEKIIPEGGVSA